MTISKEDLFSRLHKLPSMPVVLQEILASFSNENIDLIALAQLISQDQGLSAKVLRISNSPFYGLPRSISSIQDAIVVLGFNTVRSLVLSAGIVTLFPQDVRSSFDRVTYWKRSFMIAGYVRELAPILGQDSQFAFTAAIFHEVGLLVLDVCMPVELSQVLQQHEFSGNDLMAIEQNKLGFDHHEIGGELARLWNFPAAIEQVIRYWHVPEHQPYDPLSSLVYIAVLLESGLRGVELMEKIPRIVSLNSTVNWDDIEQNLPDFDELNEGAAILAA